MPGETRHLGSCRPRRTAWGKLGVAGLLATWLVLGVVARADDREIRSMADRPARALLLEYAERLARDGDRQAFRAKVATRYTEGTLGRLLADREAETRRAAMLALSEVGTIQANPLLGRGFADPDARVRLLAHDAAWEIWFRAGSPDQVRELAAVRDLIASGRLEEATDRATALIARAPEFAEAYNQRAIARFQRGRYAESAADCRAVVERVPQHFGALGGLAQCQLRQGERAEAIATLRRLAKLEPLNTQILESIAMLEAGGDDDGP